MSRACTDMSTVRAWRSPVANAVSSAVVSLRGVPLNRSLSSALLARMRVSEAGEALAGGAGLGDAATELDCRRAALAQRHRLAARTGVRLRRNARHPHAGNYRRRCHHLPPGQSALRRGYRLGARVVLLVVAMIAHSPLPPPRWPAAARRAILGTMTGS